jgi:N-methylhydantoinase B
LGNTHCADFTVCAPVFFENRIVFHVIARAHFGDMGFPTPTTYSPTAKDVYEEGLTLPCVRIQKDYRDVSEVIDICRANVRVPDQFYGDYLAVLAAVRTGENRLVELCRKHGLSKLEAFLEEFQKYAQRMAVDAIRRLPAGKVTKEVLYDSEYPDLPEGIPIRATLTVDPAEATVVVDLRDNIDNLPLGINLTESTVTAACMTAVLNILGPEVPRCTGSFQRVRLLLRDGCAIGRPKFPAATSAATTNLCHVLVPHIQSMFSQLRPDLGTAYGTIGMPGSCAVISGEDARHGGRPFVNQLIMGYWGGPAMHGHDGWLTYGSGASQGILWQSSVEVVEQQQPILIEKLEIQKDSGGAGEWQGGPGAECVIRSRSGPVRFIVNSASRQHPPQGVAGGQAAGPMRIAKVRRDGSIEELPISVDTVVAPGERLLSDGCGGGGFGDPLRRTPDDVQRDIAEGFISLERARDVFGVILDENGHETVDRQATLKRRQELAALRAAS